MRTRDTSILKEFFGNFNEITYRKGDVIVLAHDEPGGVYLIKNGVVKMSYIDSKGIEFIANIFKPGTFFPMTWAIGEIGNEYQYEALTPVKIIKVPRDIFIQFLEDNPGVLFNLTKRILIGLDGLLFNMRNLLNGSSKSATAVILAMLAKRFGDKTKSGKTEISIKFTHQDIANFAGITRESATLAINQLERQKIIIQVKRKIVVNSLSELEKVYRA